MILILIVLVLKILMVTTVGFGDVDVDEIGVADDGDGDDAGLGKWRRASGQPRKLSSSSTSPVFPLLMCFMMPQFTLVFLTINLVLTLETGSWAKWKEIL